MKKLFIALSALLLVSCEQKPFTGYVVCKEYIQGHMCHSNDYKHQVTEAYVPIHVTPHVQHHHTWEPSQFILYIANRYDVRQFHVDSCRFHRIKLLYRVTME